MVYTRKAFWTLLYAMIIAIALQSYFIFTHYYHIDEQYPSTSNKVGLLLQAQHGRLPRKILNGDAAQSITDEDSNDSDGAKLEGGDAGASKNAISKERHLSSRDLFELTRTQNNGSISLAIASLKNRFRHEQGPMRIPTRHAEDDELDKTPEDDSLVADRFIWQGNRTHHHRQQQHPHPPKQIQELTHQSKPGVPDVSKNVKHYKIQDGILVARAVLGDQMNFVVRNKPRPATLPPKENSIQTVRKTDNVISNNQTQGILNSINWRRYLDPHNYRYILNPKKACVRSKGGFLRIQLLILVTSSLSNFDKREVIRNTWGTSANLKSPNGGVAVKTLFLLGNNPKLNLTSIDYESRLHSDIIMEDFLDTYLNLTVKTVMGLKWADRFCPHAKYVMKTDDDMTINTPHLLGELMTMPWRNFIGGKVALNYPVLRDVNQKFYVPVDVYEEQDYPPYVVGLGYVMSMNLVHNLYIAAKNTPLFPWEDVFIGILLKNLGIRAYPIKHFFTGGYFKDADSQEVDPMLIPQLMSTSTIHQLTIGQMYTVWSLWSDEKREKRHCRRNGRCRVYE